MDLEKIEGLIKIIEKSSLTTFSIKEGDVKISMSKIKYGPGVPEGMAVSYAAVEAAENGAEAEEEEQCFITSPIVGTFYAAASPDEPAFVKVGDVVKGGQTVCILEAMKLMNEIESDFDCEIEAILVSNEQKVEYGQPLFRVKKL
ncbi:MAG: acetyl-CoA carboxylase biotin carboxyl carrier protein [Clostridiales bacterium]|uniref:acetyl-CoA carboxylase biotin carboxyl carrier protein n=1 Tax=Robinsoniella sp. TaxID=2496533 RepID=UPI002908F96B|nr:acetyl-CoA carboxylase biotin carboxyl carrier protein [Clostridiales bacterium]MDU3240500.1 acetyl-CoA carboxylase biotin carboxyl carrier protein [Clostridiales bacterium]